MQLHPPWNGRLHGNEEGESGGGRFGTKSPPTFRLAAMQQLRDFNVHGIPRASFQLGNSCFDADIGEGVLHEGREELREIESRGRIPFLARFCRILKFVKCP